MLLFQITSCKHLFSISSCTSSFHDFLNLPCFCRLVETPFKNILGYLASNILSTWLHHSRGAWYCLYSLCQKLSMWLWLQKPYQEKNLNNSAVVDDTMASHVPKQCRTTLTEPMTDKKIVYKLELCPSLTLVCYLCCRCNVSVILQSAASFRLITVNEKTNRVYDTLPQR